jgi:hypothetical protein
MMASIDEYTFCLLIYVCFFVKKVLRLCLILECDVFSPKNSHICLFYNREVPN